mgnify:CR=1 FL=1
MAKIPDHKASDFDPDVLRLFDQYVHGAIDRRGFLIGAARFAVGAAGAAGLLAALNPQFAAAQEVAPDDARLDAKYIEFASPQGYGTGRGYLVKPAKMRKPLPVVLVAHENRGLNPHIEDIARRLALANFIAFAPDALFPLGGYPGEEDAARALFGGSFRDWRQLQPIKAGALVVAQHTSQSAIDDAGNAFDRQRRFGDVGREDHFAALGRR